MVSAVFERRSKVLQGHFKLITGISRAFQSDYGGCRHFRTASKGFKGFFFSEGFSGRSGAFHRDDGNFRSVSIVWIWSAPKNHWNPMKRPWHFLKCILDPLERPWDPSGIPSKTPTMLWHSLKHSWDPCNATETPWIVLRPPGAFWDTLEPPEKPSHTPKTSQYSLSPWDPHDCTLSTLDAYWNPHETLESALETMDRE